MANPSDSNIAERIPNRGELARRLLGAGRRFSPERDAVAEIIAERAAESDRCAKRLFREQPAGDLPGKGVNSDAIA
jgi:hypothetical protein